MVRVCSVEEAVELWKVNGLDGTLVLIEEGHNYRVVKSSISHLPMQSVLQGTGAAHQCGHCFWPLEQDETDQPCHNCGFIFPVALG